MHEQKTWVGQTELKEDAEGQFVARISTLNVTDKDLDVTLPGAFAGAKTVRVSRFNHSSAIRDDLPVGIAKIHEDGDAVIATGQLNLSSPGGKALFDTLRFEQEHGVSSEWSYGFTVEDSERGEHDDGKSVRFLKKLQPFEVSPVMRGAGQSTATLAIKTATDFVELPLYPRDYRWDSGAAIGRVRKWASSDGSGEKETIDWEKYKKAFFWYDPEDDSSFAGFKLPYADVTDSKLTAVPRGIFAAAAALQGARGGVSISETDIDHVRDVIDRWYAVLREEFSDESIRAPWTKSAGGLTLAHDAETVLVMVEEYVGRVSSLADMRQQEGRPLSAANIKRLVDVKTGMDKVVEHLGSLLQTPSPDMQMLDPLADVARFQHTIAQYGRE
jgi:hypothetical protein